MASCAHSPLPRLAEAEGELEAGIRLAQWPAHCRAAVPHAEVAIGANPVSTLKRERLQLDFANQRAANCADWYDTQKAALEAANEPE